MSGPYRGRFAPSPTGPMHLGSLTAALASWCDARAHGGTWLVRIEDLDPPREMPGATARILEALARVGLDSDEPIVYQSARGDRYAAALARLEGAGLVYGCDCSRKEVHAATAAIPGWPEGVYPGTCRGRGRTGARRIVVPDREVAFVDRALGPYAQHLTRDVGDFVLRRADGLWAYQLAVVVDDHAQGITDVVRGRDLMDNTPRQIFLAEALGFPTLRYLHAPLATNERGEKLSKQSGAPAFDVARPLAELERAGAVLGLPHIGASSVPAFLARAVEVWRERNGVGRLLRRRDVGQRGL